MTAVEGAPSTISGDITSDWRIAKQQFDSIAGEILTFSASLRAALPPSACDSLVRLERRVVERRRQVDQMIANMENAVPTLCKHCGKAMSECGMCGVD